MGDLEDVMDSTTNFRVLQDGHHLLVPAAIILMFINLPGTKNVSHYCNTAAWARAQ